MLSSYSRRLTDSSHHRPHVVWRSINARIRTLDQRLASLWTYAFVAYSTMSFYAVPRQPLSPERRAFADTLPSFSRPEVTTPRMRVCVSMMTNGRSHTKTTSSVVSAYHLGFTRLWQLVSQGNVAQASDQVALGLTPDDPLTPLRRQAITALVAEPDGPRIFATLLDLLRISLTYVTDKKGGDATAAVDSLNVDWNENAVKSAKQYLNFSSFLCDVSLSNCLRAPGTNTQ